MPAVLRSSELSRLEWVVAIGTAAGWRSQPKSLAYTPNPDASGKSYAPKMACAPREGYPQLQVEVAMMTLRLLRKTALGQLSWERPRAAAPSRPCGVRRARLGCRCARSGARA